MRSGLLDLTDAKSVFDQITDFKMSGQPAEACDLARRYLQARNGRMPVTSLGLWICVNAGRCALDANDRELASILYSEMQEMIGVDLPETGLLEITDECIAKYRGAAPQEAAKLEARRSAGDTHHEVWMQPGWDARSHQALDDLRRYCEQP